MTPEVSVIVCSIDPDKLERAKASYALALARTPHEFVTFTDARSLAEAYNRGIDRARGSTLVFSHDDVEMLTPDLGAKLAHHLAHHDVIGIAGTTRLVGGGWYFAGSPFDYMLVVSPNPKTGQQTMIVEGDGPLVVPGIEALDGVFMATRAAVARALRFDAETFDHFHLYDLDFSYRARLSGLRLAVCRDLVLIHHSSGHYDDRWDEHRRRFERKFAGRLAPAAPRREPRIINVPLDEKLLADPAGIAQLCRPEALARVIQAIGAKPFPAH